MNKIYPIILAMLMVSAIGAYTTHIDAPAVLLNRDNGILTSFYLNVTPGDGSVTITGPSSIGEDTNESAASAVLYATNYLGVNESMYNFTYTVKNSSSISGPSAGAAMAVLAVAALEHRQLYPNFSMTGTVALNGTVGQIGGVYDKAEAAARAGKKFLLVPWAASGSFEDEIYYIAQETWNIPLIEVANVSQALPYAFGQLSPSTLSLNVTANYAIASLPTANLTCTSCNMTAFWTLANYTFATVNNSESAIGSNYAPVKAELSANLQEYKELAQKGYLYSAADLSFLDYVRYPYVLDNSANATSTNAQEVIDNLSGFCRSLTPPTMTDKNYEYVVSGEIRQAWAISNLKGVQEALNVSEDSDDVLDVITSVADSAGWCNAAKQMYSTAATIGGTPVNTSASIKQQASDFLNNPNVPTGIYSEAALLDYDQGRYAAALYDSIYAEQLETAIPANEPVITNATVYSNESNLNAGAWPVQFGNQALFYIYQADNSKNATYKKAYQEDAYSVFQLALGLDSIDKQLYSSFIYNTSSQPTGVHNSTNSTYYNVTPAGLTSLQSQINQIYYVMLALIVILFIILIVLLLHLLRPHHDAPSQQPVQQSQTHNELPIRQEETGATEEPAAPLKPATPAPRQTKQPRRRTRRSKSQRAQAP
jgi:predicted S18 family serine protease